MWNIHLFRIRIFKNGFSSRLAVVGVVIIPAYDAQLSESLRRMNAGVKEAFGRVKEEMNQHLDAINQNTNEIQACYEYLAELDAKLDKMAERLDALQFSISSEQVPAITLTHREQEVFLVLYTREDPVTSVEVARRLGLTVEMVDQYLTSIVAKGVPLLRTFASGKVYHSLDLKFKDLQARKNVLGIGEAVSQQLLNEKAI